MNCGVGHRSGSHLALLWLWCRPAATASIQPLAWEAPYAAEAALEMAKRQQQQQKKIPDAGSSHCGSAETNLTSFHEDAGLIPGLAQWIKDPAP